jgi:endonuclease/exonuclease/phosphatase family metal-dependent hydrolase
MRTFEKIPFLTQVSRLILPTLAVIFGLQFLRTLIPSLVWYLRDSVGVGTLDLIPYAFGTFFLGFLAALLRRIFGARGSLWLTAGGIAVLRMVEQMIQTPGVDLWLSIGGLGFFLNFLSIFIGQVRSHGEWAASRWVYGLILGLAVDIALRGVFGMRDLNTIDGWLPISVIALGALVLLVSIWREPVPGGSGYSGTTFGRALSLLAIGPYLMIQVLFFSSQGFLEEVVGLTASLGFVLVLMGYVLSAGGAWLGFMQSRSFDLLVSLGITGYLGYALVTADRSGFWFLLTLLLGQFLLGWGLSVVARSNAKAETRGLRRTTFSVGSGLLIFLILVFGFYVSQDMALPFPRSYLPAVAAILIGTLTLIASLQVRGGADRIERDASGLGLACMLLLVPLGSWIIAGEQPQSIQATGEPVGVMTYNIHSGFNAAGHQNLEGIARVIEESGVQVVALQEVSRMRLMDGGTDIPGWLSRRVDMPYIFKGTEEPIWGNAILSQYPILESGWGDLPRAGKLIGRGYLWAKIDVGRSEPLLVIVTHLHHLGPDTQARQEQVPVLLEFWNDSNFSVILGDMNAEPSSAEMEMFSEAGLLDAWRDSEGGPGFTFSSTDPVTRIDYIWHTQDLRPLEIEVIQTLASDHLPVVAVLEPISE